VEFDEFGDKKILAGIANNQSCNLTKRAVDGCAYVPFSDIILASNSFCSRTFLTPTHGF
jgi:hypothetical protein